MKTLTMLLLLTLTSCTSPCPKPEPYLCPPDLGTTWGETNAQGCTRYVCSVGGRGGFVEGER